MQRLRAITSVANSGGLILINEIEGGPDARRSLRNRWYGSHGGTAEGNRAWGSSFRKDAGKRYGAARREGVTSDGGVVHHFIAGANENIHRLLPPLHPCSVGMTEGCKETSKKKKERASDVEEEKENRKGRDIWARSRARGSFHTFLQSLFLLSSWQELIFMSVLERTLASHERSTQPHTT